MERRVVITGLGAITPIGKSVDENWKSIKSGVCGIDKITLFDTEKFKVKLAGEVKDFRLEDYIEPKKAKRMDKVSRVCSNSSKRGF